MITLTVKIYNRQLDGQIDRQIKDEKPSNNQKKIQGVYCIFVEGNSEGKMKNPKVQKYKRFENVKSNNRIIIMPRILYLYFTSLHI